MARLLKDVASNSDDWTPSRLGTIWRSTWRR